MLSIRNRRAGATLIVGVALIGCAIGMTTLAHGRYATQAHEAQLAAAGASTQKPKSPLLLAQEVPGQNIEEVPELGVTITVPDSVKDLTYKTSTVTLKDGQPATLTLFSTSSLTQLDSNCSASAGPLGSFEKVSGQYPSNDPYAALNYGRLVKQYPTFYIAAGSPQAACSSKSTAQAAAIADRGGFAGAESTLEQVN
jgi:hypothetical protein